MSWDTGLSSEQTVPENPVTTDSVGGSKRLPFSFSFQPSLQRRHLWTCQLCTFDLDKPYSGIFTMPLQKEISFSFFFQSWQEQSSAGLLRFSASFLLLPAKDTARIFAWCWEGGGCDPQPVTADSAASRYLHNNSSVSSCWTTRGFSWADLSSRGIWPRLGSSH